VNHRLVSRLRFCVWPLSHPTALAGAPSAALTTAAHAATAALTSTRTISDSVRRVRELIPYGCSNVGWPHVIRLGNLVQCCVLGRQADAFRLQGFKDLVRAEPHLFG